MLKGCCNVFYEVIVVHNGDLSMLKVFV
jgi:hypothetical protein